MATQILSGDSGIFSSEQQFIRPRNSRVSLDLLNDLNFIWEFQPAGAELRHEEISLANDSRFIEAYFNQPLTNYAIGGWDKTDYDAELEFLAPAVQVPRRFTYAEWKNSEAFLSDGTNEDLRAIGADFPRAEYTRTKTSAQTDNRGLTIRVDMDEVAETPGWQEKYVGMLTNRLKRNQLRRVKTVLSAAATNTAKTWDQTAGKSPDQDIRSELIVARDLLGLRPNRVVYGDTAWDKRCFSLDAQNNAGGYRSSGYTPEQLAAYLQVDGVRVSKAVYQNTTTTKAQIVANLVLMFTAYSGAGVDDPSNIKRFWSPTASGGPVRVYIQQISAKLYDITVELYDLTKITSTIGIRQFTIS